MEITSFDTRYLSQAASLFAENFTRQRKTVPILPDAFSQPEVPQTRLNRLFAQCEGVMAVEQGNLAGFLGWYEVDGFRNTQRKAAYVPVWAHSTLETGRGLIYQLLYRAASRSWDASHCDVHAVTLLASDLAAQQTWFWNGFGMAVVDALRSIQPLNLAHPAGITLRKASPEDIELLCSIEAQHWQHYRQPPVFMAPHAPDGPEEFRAFLNQPENSAWLALDGTQAAGYLRFEGSSNGATAIVESETTISITGAFVRPDYRGRRIAASLLDAGLKDYAARGYERCSVDFESFNPEAANFWPRYFQPVCYSVMRVPEARAARDAA